MFFIAVCIMGAVPSSIPAIATQGPQPVSAPPASAQPVPQTQPQKPAHTQGGWSGPSLEADENTIVLTMTSSDVYQFNYAWSSLFLKGDSANTLCSSPTKPTKVIIMGENKKYAVTNPTIAPMYQLMVVVDRRISSQVVQLNSNKSTAHFSPHYNGRQVAHFETTRLLGF